jgi:hypothetical protein
MVKLLLSLAGLILSTADSRCKVKKQCALLAASSQKQAPALTQTHE